MDNIAVFFFGDFMDIIITITHVFPKIYYSDNLRHEYLYQKKYATSFIVDLLLQQLVFD
jgi:hypothetical protein